MVYFLNQLIIYFFIYSFLGWILEVTFASIQSHKFINRGFLFGPFCPIYGFGVLSLIVFLNHLVSKPILFFIGTIILTSTIEYITGFILEKIFKTHWWDYSKNKFNLNGYICLEFSIYWGVFGTLLFYFIHPKITHLVTNINPFYLNIISPVIFFYFLLDFIVTVYSLIKIKNIYQEIKLLQKKYLLSVDKLKQKIISNTDFKSIKKDFKNQNRRLYSKIKKYRIIKAFTQIQKSLQ